MGFPDHLLRPVLRRQIFFPALRVRPAKVRRHAALSVDPAGLRVRVRGLYPFPVQLKDKIIVDPVKVLRRAVFPDAFFQPFHGKGREGLPSASIPEQTQLRLFCEGTPDAENAFPGGPFPEGVFLENVFRVFIKKTKLPVVQIIPVKIRAFIDFFIFQSRPFHSALLFHASLSCFPHTLFSRFFTASFPPVSLRASHPSAPSFLLQPPAARRRRGKRNRAFGTGLSEATPSGTALAGAGSASLMQASAPFRARSALHRSGYAVHIESLQAQKQNGNGNGDQDGASGKAGIPAVDVFFFQHLPQTDGHGILV